MFFRHAHQQGDGGGDTIEGRAEYEGYVEEVDGRLDAVPGGPRRHSVQHRATVNAGNAKQGRRNPQRDAHRATAQAIQRNPRHAFGEEQKERVERRGQRKQANPALPIDARKAVF